MIDRESIALALIESVKIQIVQNKYHLYLMKGGHLKLRKARTAVISGYQNLFYSHSLELIVSLIASFEQHPTA